MVESRLAMLQAAQGCRVFFEEGPPDSFWLVCLPLAVVWKTQVQLIFQLHTEWCRRVAGQREPGGQERGDGGSHKRCVHAEQASQDDAIRRQSSITSTAAVCVGPKVRP
jgi:hypothetical protein